MPVPGLRWFYQEVRKDNHFGSTLMSMPREPRKQSLNDWFVHITLGILINILGHKVYFIHSPTYFSEKAQVSLFENIKMILDSIEICWLVGWLGWFILVGRGFKNYKFIVMSTWSWSAVKLVRALFAGFGWLTSCSVRRAPSTLIPLPIFKKHTTHVCNSDGSTSHTITGFLHLLAWSEIVYIF